MWNNYTKAVMLFTLVTLLSFLPLHAFAREYHWGFSKAKDGKPADAGSQFETILKKHGAYYRDHTNDKVIYLTFDNGFEAGHTEDILNTLRKEKVPATFFLVSHYLTSAPELVNQMVKDGHTIGNHSDKHKNMAKLSENEMLEEWQNFDKKLKELTGIERTYYVRPPEGIFSEKLLEVGNKHGYTHIFWSIAFRDWDTGDKKDKQYAYNELVKQLHPGAIILMHTVAKHNADALPDFIKEAKRQGYRFGTLDDLVYKQSQTDFYFQ